jgi:glycosyltransferase involved in cell wall biosynthesis
MTTGSRPTSSGPEPAEVLLLAPHLDPTILQLRELLATEHSVEIYCSDTVDVHGERNAVNVVRFYWLDPLLTMFRLVRRVWRYRVVINYYHRNGYWLGVSAWLFGTRAKVRLAWIGFAPNPRKSGVLGWIRENVTYSALLGHDLIVCNTLPVIDAIRQRYPKVADRVAYVRWGGTGDEDFDASCDKGYIFSGGRTNRDFATLFEAVAQLGFSAVIVAGKDVRFPSYAPEHITIYRDISMADFERLLQGARIVVVALKREDISSGQVVLNRAMRSGKPVVVTATAGIDDYVTNGKDAVLVAPGDVDDLQAKLKWLLDNPERREEMGLAARLTYETRFNSRIYASELFQKVTAAFDDVF